MKTGIVKFFNLEKGYGFITPDGGGKDVFVHISALQKSGVQALKSDDNVQFDVGTGRDGRSQAEIIRLI